MEGYISVKQAAEKWNISIRSVQAFCADGKIEGASKIANVWAIPIDAKMPVDGRIKTGQYVDWRKQ